MEFMRKAIERGDRVVNELTNDLLLNETFSAAVEKALVTKGSLDRKIRNILNTMNVATKADIEDVHDEMRRIRRELRALRRQFDTAASEDGAANTDE